MQNNKNNKRLETNKKINFLILFLVFLLLVYIVKLFSLQVLDVEGYKIMGERISMSTGLVTPERGDIYDRNGNPLAITEKIESLYLLPSVNQEKSEEALRILNNDEQFNKLTDLEQEEIMKQASLPVYKEEDIQKLAKILNINSDEILKLLAANQEGYIYRAISKSQKAQIDLLNLDYLMYMTLDDRYYPNDEVLANTLGFVEDDGSANYGLERYYNDVLSGEIGYREFYKALQGTEIPYANSENIDSEDAKNIVTTIDLDLQKIIHKHLENAMFDYKPMSATAVLSNPNTGEILAIESVPTFDANRPRTLDSEIDKMFISNPQVDTDEYTLNKWQNKAVSSMYEPGSVFKTVTAAAALETNSQLAEKVYEDDGYYRLSSDVVIRSWRYWDPHGPQDLKEALKNSSNPVFAQLIQDIGKEEFVKFGNRLMLGKNSGIDLPNENPGTFAQNSNINDVDFGIMSYGHYVNVNAVQFISSLNSIVNGGKYYKPHIAKEIQNDNGKTVFEIEAEYKTRTVSEETSKQINEYLEYTADSYEMNTDELKFGAKTGTAEKYEASSIFGENTERRAQVNSIFVSYPAHNPELTLLLILDEPQGVMYASDSAYPVARDIMYDILSNDHSEESIINNNSDFIQVPDLTGLSIEEAIKISDELGIKLTSDDNLNNIDIIESQKPEINNLIKKGTSVSITVGEEIKMPDFVDMDKAEALSLLNLYRMQYNIEGQGDVISSQSIKYGERINRNEKIDLQTKEK